VLWYVSTIAKLHGLSLSEVAAFNLRKLRKRYPNGFVLGGGVR
jgi:NTP pyrophosphatase (non-canonical NTP hydrolase)